MVVLTIVQLRFRPLSAVLAKNCKIYEGKLTSRGGIDAVRMGQVVTSIDKNSPVAGAKEYS